MLGNRTRKRWMVTMKNRCTFVNKEGETLFEEVLPEEEILGLKVGEVVMLGDVGEVKIEKMMKMQPFAELAAMHLIAVKKL